MAPLLPWREALVGALCVTLSGCAPHLLGHGLVPGSRRLGAPAVPWEVNRPRADERPEPPVAPATRLPSDWPLSRLESGESLALSDIVRIALRNNPLTEAAWQRLNAALQGVVVAESDFYPQVTLTVPALKQREAALGGQFTFEQTIAAPGVDIAWTLLDFGGRTAQVAESSAAAVSADFTHQQAWQDVILQTENSYFQYLNAKALSGVQAATLETARTSLDAAQARFSAGLATRADVLQARTAVSRAQLGMESVTGQIGTVKGSLAVAMGLPANTPLEVGLLPVDVPVKEVETKVEELLETAKTLRPELAASRAEAVRRSALTISAESRMQPRFDLKANVNETLFLQDLATIRNALNYTVGITFSVPLFAGFGNLASARKAGDEARAAAADAGATEQRVLLEVWTSFYALRTAGRQVLAARDLVSSAIESYDVAKGRYEAGIGTIIDLLTAQGALADARSTDVQARSQWFLALAQLAHDTGLIDIPTEGSPLPMVTGGSR